MEPPKPPSKPELVRSDPFADLRPFIVRMWITRGDMCRHIYLDAFPYAEDRRPTQVEEDTFLLKYFDPDTLRSHGGAFLKQALYAIAKYNHDGVAAFAADWATKHCKDDHIISRVFDDALDARDLFGVEVAADHDELFLNQVRCTVKRANPQQHLAETTPCSGSDHVPVIMRDSNDIATHAGEAITPEKSHTITAAHHVAKNWPSSDRLGLQQMKAEPANDRSFQPEFHNKHNPNPADIRHLDTSDPHQIPATYPGLITSENHRKKSQQPNSIADMQNAMAFPLAYHPSQQALSASQVDYQASPNYLSSPLGPSSSTGLNGPYIPLWPEPTSGVLEYGVPSEDHLRLGGYQSPALSGDRGLYDHVPQGTPSNPNSMDPDSFRRLSHNQSIHRNRRASVYTSDQRQTSMHSSGDHSSYRTVPAVFPDKRIFSDRTHSRQPSSFDKNMSEIVPPRRQEQKPPYNGRKLPNNYRRDISTSSNRTTHQEPFQGRRRQDLSNLVLTNVPGHVTLEKLHAFLSKHANVRAVRYSGGYPTAPTSTIFVHFPSSEDAQSVFERRDLSLENFRIALEVPRKNQALQGQVHYPHTRGNFQPEGPQYSWIEDSQIASTSNHNAHHRLNKDFGQAYNTSYPGGPSMYPYPHSSDGASVQLTSSTNHGSKYLPSAFISSPNEEHLRKQKGGSKKNKRKMTTHSNTNSDHQAQCGDRRQQNHAMERVHMNHHGVQAMTERPPASDRMVPSATSVNHFLAVSQKSTLPPIQAESSSPWLKDELVGHVIDEGQVRVLEQSSGHALSVSESTTVEATILEASRSLSPAPKIASLLEGVASEAPDISSERCPSVIADLLADTPSKGGEDMDESFQTAAETPDSSRSTLVTSTDQARDMTVPLMKVDEQSHHAGQTITQSSDSVKPSGMTTGYKSVGSSSKASKPNSGDTTSQSLREGVFIRSGPSKTESLSPFARPKQMIKKDKAKISKKTRRNGGSDMSGHLERHSDRSVASSMAGDTTVVACQEALSTTHLPHCETDDQEAPDQKSPARGLLNRLLGGALGLSKTNQGPAQEIATDIQPTLRLDEDIVPSPEGMRSSQLDIDSLERSITTGKFIDHEDVTPQTTKKPKKKKKKKSSKRKRDLKQDQESDIGRDDDTSSTATLQTHTPGGSRSGSVEPPQSTSPRGRSSHVKRDAVRATSTSDSQKIQPESVMAEQASVEYSMSKLSTMLTCSEEGLIDLAPTRGTRFEDILRSRLKFEQLIHEEKMRKLTVDDVSGIAEEQKRHEDAIRAELGLPWASEASGA